MFQDVVKTIKVQDVNKVSLSLTEVINFIINFITERVKVKADVRCAFQIKCRTEERGKRANTIQAETFNLVEPKHQLLKYIVVSYTASTYDKLLWSPEKCFLAC